MSLVSLLSGVGCAHCPQNQLGGRGLAHPKIKPTGPDKAPLYILGGDASQQEDAEGIPFGGEEGARLRKFFAQHKQHTIRWGLTLRCAGSGHQEAYLTAARAACHPLAQADLEACGPRVVVAVGARSLQALAGRGADLQTWRGLPFTTQLGSRPTWCIGIYPNSFIRQWGTEERWRNPAISVLESDLRVVLELLGRERPSPRIDFERIRFHDDPLPALQKLAEAPHVGLDLETSPGLYPNESQARILTVALWSPTAHAVLPITWPDRPSQEAVFIKWLHEYRGELIAHNAQFELVWLLAHYGPETVLTGKRWHDSAAAARVAFNRESPASLDAVCRIQLGAWLKEVTQVDPLQWRSTPWDQFARYNLLDAAACYYLGDSFDVWGSPSLEYKRLCEAEVTTALMELAPLPVAHEELAAQRIRLNKELQNTRRMVADLEEVKAYERRTQTSFDVGSPEHVAALVGSSSSKEETLETLDHPAIPHVLQFRRLDKIRTTYLEGWMNVLGDDGALHPRYSPLRVATGRLSSEHPNIQNVPKRRDKWVRQLINPGPGYAVLSLDYSQIELRVLASVSGDPVLIQELWERADLHTRWADRVLELHPPVWDRLRATYGTSDEAKLRKALRDEVKRGITFALPYGAGAGTPGRILHLPTSVSERINAEYWTHYPILKRWQNAQRDTYAATGTVVIPTTHRIRAALLSGNEPINNPIQGAASDIVVAAMTRLAKRALCEGDPYLLPRINIHDDLTFIVPEPRTTDYVRTIGEEMVRIVFPYIQRVPYVVEAQAGPNWYEQSVVASIDSTECGHRRPRTPPFASPPPAETVLGDSWGSLALCGSGAPGTGRALRRPARIPLRRSLRSGEDHSGENPG